MLKCSNLGDDREDLFEDVLARHVLRDGDVVRALLVLPGRLVDVEHLRQHVVHPPIGAVPRLDPLLLAALGHVQDDEDGVRAQDFSAEVSSLPDESSPEVVFCTVYGTCMYA